VRWVEIGLALVPGYADRVNALARLLVWSITRGSPGRTQCLNRGPCYNSATHGALAPVRGVPAGSFLATGFACLRCLPILSY